MSEITQEALNIMLQDGKTKDNLKICKCRIKRQRYCKSRWKRR